MDDEKQEQYTKDDFGRFVDILESQNKLIERQTSLYEETTKANRKNILHIILVFIVSITLISIAFIVCQTISEKARNNIKVENTSSSYSSNESGFKSNKSIKPQDNR